MNIWDSVRAAEQSLGSFYLNPFHGPRTEGVVQIVKALLGKFVILGCIKKTWFESTEAGQQVALHKCYVVSTATFLSTVFPNTMSDFTVL